MGSLFFQSRMMVLLAVVATTTTAVTTFAQTHKIREKPSDYPVHLDLSLTLTLAAENLARSVPVAGGGVLFAEDHLVIEIAFFGPSGLLRPPHAFGPGDFSLAVNGSKTLLLPDSPGAVARSMRDSPMNNRPTIEATGSINNSGVIIGGRRPTMGVPDIDQRNRGPQPPRAPESEDRSGRPPSAPVDVNAEVDRAALASCDACKLPSGGLLYFPFKGKLKGIKSLTLYYQHEAGPRMSLRLIP